MTKNIVLVASLALVVFLSVTAAQDKPRPPAPEIPIGGVILWWGRAVDIPEGFEACDGTVVSTKDAVLKGAKPNMQSKFVRGAENYRSFVPTEYSGGGNDSVSFQGVVEDHKFSLAAAQLPAHTHTVKEHAHDISAHTHAVGAHTHAVAGHNHAVAGHVHSYGEVTVVDNGTLYFKTGTAADADSSPIDSVKTVTVAASPTSSTALTTDTKALTTEAKALKTDKSTDGLKTGQTALTTNPTGAAAVEVTLAHAAKGSFDNKPAYVDIVFLIRVK